MLKADSDLNKMSTQVFYKLMEDKEIKKEIILNLAGHHKCSLSELEQWLSLSDKDHYVKFIAKELTFDQLRARIADTKFNVKYKVLDDFKDKLDPSFMGENLDKIRPHLQRVYGKNPTFEQVSAPLKPHQFNVKCMRSIA